MIEEIRNFHECGGGTMCGNHQEGCCGFGGRGFDSRGCFLVSLRSGRLRGCCKFELRLLRPSHLPGSCRLKLLGLLRARLGRRICIWWWIGGSLDDMPPSGNVIPTLAQVHLLGRLPGLQRFQSGRVPCGGALSALLWRMFCRVVFSSFHLVQPR